VTLSEVIRGTVKRKFTDSASPDTYFANSQL